MESSRVIRRDLQDEKPLHLHSGKQDDKKHAKGDCGKALYLLSIEAQISRVNLERSCEQLPRKLNEELTVERRRFDTEVSFCASRPLEAGLSHTYASRPEGIALTLTTDCGCMPDPSELPEPLFEIVSGLAPNVHGYSAGYEQKRWRASELARHIVEWAPDFALRDSERKGVPLGRIVSRSNEAIRNTFGTKFSSAIAGEVLLHAICRGQFGSSTLVKKVWFRTSVNVPYNGFDSVHVVHAEGKLQLWLGEAKFYKSGPKAVAQIIKDMETHLKADYLKSEFALIGPKIEDDHPHAAEMKALIRENATLDDVFDSVVLPALLVYDSPVTSKHNATTDEYLTELVAEIAAHANSLLSGVDSTITHMLRIFVIPTATKELIVEELKSFVGASA